MTYDSIITEAEALLPSAVAFRRAMHRDPEVGNHLPRTRDKVLAALEGLPLEITLHESTSGIAAVLRGAKPGPTIILRGDMDALDMPENSGEPFSSENENRMHACGHDLHTSMLVHAAKLLSAHQSELAGQVLFMFQPGEEGHAGAREMINEGLLQTVDPPPSAGLAIHVSPIYASGTMSTRPGPQMAAADKIIITVKGAGGHASAPQGAKDPVAVAAAILTNIQVAVTRQVNVFDPAVVTFGMISAGSAYNVIPETAVMTGTCRTVSEERRDAVHAMCAEVATGIASAHGLTADVEIARGYPVTVNDPAWTAEHIDFMASVFGDDRVIEMPTPIMGAEDWSYVLQQVPGAMVFLGSCPPEFEPGDAPYNHSNVVRHHERSMATGIALYATTALRHLTKTGSE
jgi:amidohydrolase